MHFDITPKSTQTKYCSKCKTIKPIDDFPIDKRRIDGHTSPCKICHNKTGREYRSSPDGKVHQRAYEKQRRLIRKLDPGYIESQLAWYNRNPLAMKARRKVHAAIRKGIIQKASECICAKCGNQARHYHHRNGYEEGHELDVIALCSSCHRIAHNEPT